MDADSKRLVGKGPGRHGDVRGMAIVFLAGAGLSWGAGNMGPVVAELSTEIGVSLGAIGVLAGTLFFAAMVVGIMAAPRIAERFGLVRTMLAASVVGALGCVIFALSSSFFLLAVGRVISGAALGLVGVLGPVFARATGGVKRVGLFGAAFQFGIAGGLGVGSALVAADVDWRVSFVVSAGVALSAVPFLVGEHVEVELQEGKHGFLEGAVRDPAVWRLAALFIAMFAVPLTLGAWFVHLEVLDGVGIGLAGALAFVLFGVSAVMREVGGLLAGRGVSTQILVGGTPLLGVLGLLIAAFFDSPGSAVVAVVLMASGFALPYSAMMIEAQKLFPPEPAQPVALLTMLGTAIAIGTIPLLGVAINGGEGSWGLAILAVVVAIAAALNVKPVTAEIRERVGRS